MRLAFTLREKSATCPADCFSTCFTLVCLLLLAHWVTQTMISYLTCNQNCSPMHMECMISNLLHLHSLVAYTRILDLFVCQPDLNYIII